MYITGGAGKTSTLCFQGTQYKACIRQRRKTVAQVEHTKEWMPPDAKSSVVAVAEAASAAMMAYSALSTSPSATGGALVSPATRMLHSAGTAPAWTAAALQQRPTVSTGAPTAAHRLPEEGLKWDRSHCEMHSNLSWQPLYITLPYTQVHLQSCSVIQGYTPPIFSAVAMSTTCCGRYCGRAA